MTKADIVNEIAKSTGVEKVQVQAIVKAFMDSVKGAMIKVRMFTCAVSVASSLRSVLRRLLVTSLRILQSLSQSTTFQLSSQLRALQVR